LYATVFAFVSAVDAVVVVARALVIVWRRSILSRPREAGERSNWRQKRRGGRWGLLFISSRCEISWRSRAVECVKRMDKPESRVVVVVVVVAVVVAASSASSVSIRIPRTATRAR
jgi:hypothetical protein